MSTAVSSTEFGRSILSLYGLLVWVSAAIIAIVFIGLAWVLLHFRERPGGPLPRQIRGHTLLELSWTIAPALVLLIIAIPTIQVIFRTQGAAPRGALEVTVRGWQWWWEFRYPSLGVVTANELYLPVGQPVVLRLEGPDVIHSFWIPRLGGKRDVVPGRINQLTFTIDQAGEYWGQCAEFCGTSHANMRMQVIAVPRQEFDRWAARQKAPAPEPAEAAADGKAIYARSACVGCHTIRGVSAGAIAPDLTHFGSRKTLAAGLLPNDLENLTTWIVDPPRVKPGAKMPAVGLNAAEARAVATYLLSLK
ncbi:MAG: cytochrome c oxidase subunit II [Candidatus Rokubacteria bacterium]|nr:cytochrome c oxidase subunit II [Candidatus Rokubacteria bacterium]